VVAKEIRESVVGGVAKGNGDGDGGRHLCCGFYCDFCVSIGENRGGGRDYDLYLYFYCGFYSEVYSGRSYLLVW
jgi:hypothetical protein